MRKSFLLFFICSLIASGPMVRAMEPEIENVGEKRSYYSKLSMSQKLFYNTFYVLHRSGALKLIKYLANNPKTVLTIAFGGLILAKHVRAENAKFDYREMFFENSDSPSEVRVGFRGDDYSFELCSFNGNEQDRCVLLNTILGDPRCTHNDCWVTENNVNKTVECLENCAHRQDYPYPECPEFMYDSDEEALGFMRELDPDSDIYVSSVSARVKAPSFFNKMTFYKSTDNKDLLQITKTVTPKTMDFFEKQAKKFGVSLKDIPIILLKAPLLSPTQHHILSEYKDDPQSSILNSSAPASIILTSERVPVAFHFVLNYFFNPRIALDLTGHELEHARQLESSRPALENEANIMGTINMYMEILSNNNLKYLCNYLKYPNDKYYGKILTEEDRPERTEGVHPPANVEFWIMQLTLTKLETALRYLLPRAFDSCDTDISNCSEDEIKQILEETYAKLQDVFLTSPILFF